MSGTNTLTPTATGYTVDRATLTKMLDMFRLPERSTTESSIVSDFLAAHISEYTSFDFTVRVGQGRPPNPAHDPGVQANTVRSSKMVIDMIGWQGNQPTIFEVKLRATHYALGQVISYAHLWQEDNPNALPPYLAVVARSSEPDMERVFQAHGVTVYLFEPDAPGGTAPSGGVSPGNGAAA
jgi:hypothetical protein